ncbi:hypothetical protein [Curtobacterium luteum]|uniref:Uncharacterized protein n=1 Tax=Curtobacterium luteum TaxID=33881 RepID=A0A175RM23_9MICO|nr:hypothetical protein [Curtobacterium luteum]KTR04750.1 hypothetical protein NS184_11085 [Curtobacterium luteum]
MSVAVAATIALGATGCEFVSPVATAEIQQVTDGVNAKTGSIDIRNALLISDDGESARFIGTFVNNSDSKDVTLSIEVGGDTQTVDVPKNSRVDLAASDSASTPTPTPGTESNGEGTQGSSAAGGTDVVFDQADAKPGSLVKVYFSYSGAEGVSLNVPVLTTAQEEYATLAPTSAPSDSATPSDSSTSDSSKSGSTEEPSGDATTEAPINP